MAVSYQKSWLVEAVIRAADLKASLKAGQFIFCEVPACRQKGICIAHTSYSMQQGISGPCVTGSIMRMYVLLRAWRPLGTQDRGKS